MRDAAIVHLHELVWDADDPAPEQREWKVSEAEGALLAFERLGVLSAEDAVSWRDRLVGRADAEAEPIDSQAWASGKKVLAELIDEVPQLRRQPSDEQIAKSAECAAAIDAFHAIGGLTDDERGEWQRKRLAKEAPWLDEVPTPGDGVAIAISVPPETAEEAAEDRALEEEWAARPKAENVMRVIGGSSAVQAGLAIVALVVHEDATTVHFHSVGDPIPDEEDEALEGFTTAVDALTPPRLVDDQGTVYVAVGDRPASATGTGGFAGVSRRRVVAGSWQYKPAAPQAATRFEAELDGRTWTLRSS
ncbi:MAG: hypothetical protein ACRDJ2_06110 [Actinomycetota bacterium]